MLTPLPPLRARQTTPVYSIIPMKVVIYQDPGKSECIRGAIRGSESGGARSPHAANTTIHLQKYM
jgi:hypothetical protein